MYRGVAPLQGTRAISAPLLCAGACARCLRVLTHHAIFIGVQEAAAALDAQQAVVPGLWAPSYLQHCCLLARPQSVLASPPLMYLGQCFVTALSTCYLIFFLSLAASELYMSRKGWRQVCQKMQGVAVYMRAGEAGRRGCAISGWLAGSI